MDHGIRVSRRKKGRPSGPIASKASRVLPWTGSGSTGTQIELQAQGAGLPDRI